MWESKSLSYKTFFADIVVIYDIIITLKNLASDTIAINAVFGWKTLIIKFYDIGFTFTTILSQIVVDTIVKKVLLDRLQLYLSYLFKSIDIR